MKNEYCLEKSDFYRYLQLRNHFKNNIKNKTDFDEPILKIFTGAYQGDLNKGVISKFYKDLMIKKKKHSTEYIKEKWEKEGNFLILNEEWLDVCKFPGKCTNSHIVRLVSLCLVSLPHMSIYGSSCPCPHCPNLIPGVSCHPLVYFRVFIVCSDTCFLSGIVCLTPVIHVSCDIFINRNVDCSPRLLRSTCS